MSEIRFIVYVYNIIVIVMKLDFIRKWEFHSSRYILLLKMIKSNLSHPSIESKEDTDSTPHGVVMDPWCKYSNIT